MTAHVFVDETKERGFYVAAAAVLPANLAASRKAINALVMPRQNRIHFHKESDPRRDKILGAIRGLGAQVVIYDACAHRNPKRARDACLDALVTDLAAISAHRLILELDESTLRTDRALLYDRVRAAGLADDFQYHHLRSREEALLAIPDAVAWCWARGNPWRTKLQGLVTQVRAV